MAVAKFNFSHNGNIYKTDLGAIHLPVIPACGKLRQEAKESEARLGDTAQLFFLTKDKNNKTNKKEKRTKMRRGKQIEGGGGNFQVIGLTHLTLMDSQS